MQVTRFTGPPEVRIFVLDNGTIQVVLVDPTGELGSIIPIPVQEDFVKILRILADEIEKVRIPRKDGTVDPKNN